MNSGADQRIKVGIRVRKLTKNEKDKNKALQWKYSDNQVWQVDPHAGKKTGNSYTFDYVFGMDTSSKNIFDDLVKPIVESSVKGFNGTIFAYGQTSSGKTYTMLGEKSEEGIIPLSVNHVFKTAEKLLDREYLIRVSYVEIYNEKIHDLLEMQNSLKIHEDQSGQAYVTSKEEVVDCPEKVLAIMKKGEKMRRFGVTDINERSSRSHTIFRIIIESRRQQSDMSSDENYWGDAVQISHLNLIDLAGSERVIQTRATGDRFKEGCAINTSLFHLGKVISQLSEGSSQYVNFRDSKLTRILASSLGGNAHTGIICTITPASVEETASTLSFASRAIRVTNQPLLNEIVSDECLLRRHALLVKKLEMELEKAKQENDCEVMKKELEQKEKIICRLKDWIKRDKLQVSSPRMVSHSDRRKTWSACDLGASLKRAQALQHDEMSSLMEYGFDCDTMDLDSSLSEISTHEKEKRVKAGCHGDGQRSCGISNKENCLEQIPRLSWHTPLLNNSGKESKKGSLGASRLKKRKITAEDIYGTEELLSQISEKDERIRHLESMVEEYKLKLNGFLADQKEMETNEKVSQSVEIPPPEESGSHKALLNDLSEQLCRSKEECEEATAQLNNERLKVSSLEISLEKQTLELETLMLKNKEFISKYDSNEEKVLDDKIALSKEFKIMLDEKKEDNGHEFDLMMKLRNCKKKTANFEMQLQQNDAMIQSLILNGDELESALAKEKQYSAEAQSQLKETLESIANISRELALVIRSGEMDVEVNEDVETISGQDDMSRLRVMLQTLSSLVGDFKLNIDKERHVSNIWESELIESRRDLFKLNEQVDGQTSIISEMGEEILALKSQLERYETQSAELRSERKEFENLWNQEKEKVCSQHAELQSLLEDRDCLLNQVLESSERLKNADVELATTMEKRMEITSDLQESSSRVKELEEEVQANVVMIANLAESDEEHLVELQELMHQIENLQEELRKSHEIIKSLSEEINLMKENSVPLESFNEMKLDIMKLSSDSESYQQQAKEEREAYKELEKRNDKVLEEMCLLTEEKEMLVTANEEIKLESLREHTELMETKEALEEAKFELSCLAKEKENLISSLNLEKDQSNAMQGSIHKTMQEIESLTKELQEVKEAHNMKDEELKEMSLLKEELERVQMSLSICAQSEEELDNLLSVEKEKVNSLNDGLAKAVAEKEELSMKYEDLKLSVGELEEKLKLSSGENVELVKNESQLRSLNEELSKQIVMVEADLNSYKKSLISVDIELKSHLEKMELEVSTKANEIVRLSSSNAELSSLLELSNKKMQELVYSIAKLNEELTFSVKEVNDGKEKIKELNNELVAVRDRMHSEATQLQEESKEITTRKLTELKSALDMAEERMKVLIEETSAEKTRYDEVICTLNLQLQDVSAEFEIAIKQKEEKIIALENDLQTGIEKSIEKLEECESLLTTKSDLELKLKEITSENEKLVMDLESARESIQKITEETSAEVRDERTNHEQNISSLKKQLQDANEEFEIALKQKDEKSIALENDLQTGIEKSIEKLEECESLLTTKSDLELKLKEITSENEKLVMDLESARESIQKITEETSAEVRDERTNHEQNISSLKKQLQDANEEFEIALKQKDEKSIALENDLQTEIEKSIEKLEECESLLTTKSDLELKLKEITSENEKLVMDLESARESIQKITEETSAEVRDERTNHEQNISSLKKQLQDANEEFEIALKQKEEKSIALENDLQTKIEKSIEKLEECESLLTTKSDLELKLKEIASENEKLVMDLESARESIQKITEETSAEVRDERTNHKQNISYLKKQLQDANEEFEIALKQKDEKICLLEADLICKTGKINENLKECAILQVLKNQLEKQVEQLSSEKEKLATVDRKLLEEETKTQFMERRLEQAQEDYTALSVRLNQLEHDLQSHNEHNSELGKALELAKADLSSNQSTIGKLQTETDNLRSKLREEMNSKQQLDALLNLEQGQLLSARAAEKKILGVLDAQEKAMSAFETTITDLRENLNFEREKFSDLKNNCKSLESKLAEKDTATQSEFFLLRQENKNLFERLKGFIEDNQLKATTCDMLNNLQEKDKELEELKNKMSEAVTEREKLESELSKSHEEGKTLHIQLKTATEQLALLRDSVQEKQKELTELSEKYLERDDYGKRMDQWVDKMEKRVTIAVDYRLEVQQKAKAAEAELRLKINQMKNEKETLEQKISSDCGKCKCRQHERNEALEIRVEEFKNAAFIGGRNEAIPANQPKLTDSAVQTSPKLEVVETDPNGCGVVQLYKIDLLQEQMRKLEKDKESLKQICRRRHNQREELKQQLEELKIKYHTLESQGKD